MSRIGKKPVPIPAGVQVNIKGQTVEVKGKLGSLTQTFRPEVEIKKDGNHVLINRSDDAPVVRAVHGLTRALINNMVLGVSTGFKRELDIQGVGFRGELQGKDLVLQVGFSHPVRITPPAGVSFAIDRTGRIVTIEGIDKAMVGQVAANVRGVRKPEPYKGKGIRYMGERIRQKAGKAGKASK